MKNNIKLQKLINNSNSDTTWKKEFEYQLKNEKIQDFNFELKLRIIILISFMKRMIAYPLTWILFYIGDGTSRIFTNWNVDILYPIYNKCMIWSSNIQDYGGLKDPWKEPNKNK